MLLCVKVRDTDGDLFCQGPAHTRVTYSRDSYFIITCCLRAKRLADGLTLTHFHIDITHKISDVYYYPANFSMAAKLKETLAGLGIYGARARSQNCVKNRCVVKIPLIHIHLIIGEVVARGCRYIEFPCTNVVPRYTRLQGNEHQMIHVQTFVSLEQLVKKAITLICVNMYCMRHSLRLFLFNREHHNKCQ